MIYPREEAISYMNLLGKESIPFVFFTDFFGQKAWIKPEKEILPDELKYRFSDSQSTFSSTAKSIFTFKKSVIPFEAFKTSYDQVLHELNIGNSYLINLTFRTPIETDLTLEDIFEKSHATYKLKYRNDFVVFSPETFIRIENGWVWSYPMKGTIDAAIPDAEEVILSDHKEMSEHVTIVDLIRNDLSQIADEVSVTRFRYISTIQTYEKTLLQVSSEIKGRLIHQDLGSNLFALLPAGSVSGAPKKQTVEIIRQVEQYERNYFTGVCGHYDGEKLDSGVMIRFIEREGNQLFFKSGGGITALSGAMKEYQEIKDKVYVPIH